MNYITSDATEFDASSESSDDEMDVIASTSSVNCDDIDEDGEELPTFLVKPSNTPQPMAEWEKHTKVSDFSHKP